MLVAWARMQPKALLFDLDGTLVDSERESAEAMARALLAGMGIAIEQSDAERGKVSGTPVGCACGDGVIDWAKMIDICRGCERDIVFSVECGTVEQAERSIEHLKGLL